MLRRSRLLCALAAIAVLAIAAPAQAQTTSRIRVLVANDTPNCMWITFYHWDSSGPFGTLAGAQITNNPRSQTGPLAIAPRKSFEFQIPRVRRFRLRVESMQASCHGNVGGDSDTTLDDAANIDYYHFTLRGSDRKIWIERTR
jgi:hypothetical protein